MRLRAKVWMTIVAVCVALTVYEIPNARLIWRYARMVNRGFDSPESEQDIKSRLTDALVAADPEAADVLVYCLAEPSDEDLAGLVARYPDNEFFLAQLAKRLTEADLVDPRAALSLADRLVALAPDNAHYRYMKGWILLSEPWRPGRGRHALEQFELGNALGQFYLPHSKYKQRLDALCDKAGLGPLDRRRATPSETGVYWEFVKCMHSWYGPHTKLDAKLADSLSMAAAEIGSRLLDHAQDAGDLESSAFLLRQAEGARLRRLNLSESELQQIRFRFSQAIEIQELAGRWFHEILSLVLGLAKIVLAAAVPLLVLSQLPLVWLFVVIVNCLRRWAKHARVGVKAYILFVIGLSGIFGLLILLGLLNERFGVMPYWALACLGPAMIVWIALWLLARIYPVDHARFRRARRWAALVCGLLWVAGTVLWAVENASVFNSGDAAEWLGFLGVVLGWSALCVVIWAVAAYRHHVFRAIPYDRLLHNRFVQLLLVLLLMTGVTVLLRPIPVAPAISVFFTILFAALVATHAPRGRLIFIDGLRRFFGKEGEIVLTRTKIAHIVSTVLVVCWLPVLAAIHISAAKWRRLDIALTDPLSFYRPLPQATRETYERVLSRKDSAQSGARLPAKLRQAADTRKHLYLATPEDMSAIIAEGEASGTPLSDTTLRWLLRICGHDVRPVILKALKDPNAEDVLIIRAKWADRSVKGQLERIFELKLAELIEIASRPKIGRKLRSEVQALRERSLRLFRPGTSERQIEDRHQSQPQSELGSLLLMADALACISQRREAEARYHRLLGGLEEYGPLPRFIPTGQESFVLASTRDYLGQLVKCTEDASPSTSEARQPPNAIDAKGANAADVLIAKAQSGDESVKEKLEEIFESRLGLLFEVASQQGAEKELLPPLLHIAGALAFVSDPQEAQDRFSRFMEPLVEATRQSHNPPAGRSFWSTLYDRDYEILFYRSLEGVPRPNATALFKTYVQQIGLADLFEGSEFLDVIGRLADRELAEQIFEKVTESPPTEDSYDIPVGEPFNILDLERIKHPKDVSHKFLETIFPQLGEESIPLLLQHLDSDHDQLRAFVVWCLTTLRYEWPAEQVRALQGDPFWKVRLNALFVYAADELETALDDESSIVQVVAQTLRGSRRAKPQSSPATEQTGRGE